MPVDDAPDDDDVRQTYNFAPGTFGLVYRADVPEYGSGPKRAREEVGEAADAAEVEVEEATKDTRTRYKLQAMKWGMKF